MPLNELVESSSVGGIQGVTSATPTTPVVTPLSWSTTILLPCKLYRLLHKSSSDLPVILPECCVITRPRWLFFSTCYTTPDPCSLLLKCVRVGMNRTHRFIDAVVGHTDSCNCSWKKGMKGWLFMKTLCCLDISYIDISTPAVFCCSLYFLLFSSFPSCFFLAELALWVRPQGVKF